MIRWCRNLWRALQYARFGWRNPDWDQAYLLELMEFKLERMAKFFREHGVAVDHKRRAAEMDALRRVLRNIREEKPQDQSMEEFGFPSEDWKNFPREKFRKMIAREEELWQEEFRKLDLILRRRLRYWWD
jgi:hypothetical protein